MCTVVSGTVFIVIRLHASDRIKLITVHQRIFDKKQYFMRQTHDYLKLLTRLTMKFFKVNWSIMELEA